MLEKLLARVVFRQFDWREEIDPRTQKCSVRERNGRDLFCRGIFVCPRLVLLHRIVLLHPDLSICAATQLVYHVWSKSLSALLAMI